MPERIQSMSSTMSILGRCRIEPPVPTEASRKFYVLTRGGGLGLSFTVLLELHIRGLLTADGERPVTFASYRLDHLPVIDTQMPTPVTDRSRILHRSGRDCNSGAAHAEMLGDSLLSNMNHIVFYAVYKEQQPNGKSLLGRMKNGAGGTL